MFRAFLCVLALLLLPPPLSAQRLRQTIGAYVGRAEVIALADAEPTGDKGYDTGLTFHEILKGDPHLVGQTYVLDMRTHGIESPFVPHEAKNILVLLDSDWRKPGHDAVVEAYLTPADIALVRALIPIYAMPSEKARIEALRAHISDADPRWQGELFWALGEMRDPVNYPLITGLYPVLDAMGQRKLLTLIGDIGDPRGLPTVLAATRSADPGVRGAAFYVLQFHFPGVPGVADAVRSLLADAKLRPSAAAYLLRYFSHDAPLKAIVDATGTPYSNAEELRAKGKVAESNRYYFQVIADPKENGYVRRWSAQWLVPTADAALKARVRPLLLPLLAQNAATGDYIEAEEAAGLLRALHSQECLPALLTMLDQRQNDWGHSHPIATQAIRELGPAARQQAAAYLLQKIKGMVTQPDTHSVDFDHDNLYFLELAWIGDKAAYEEVGRVMDKRYQQIWETTLPLAGVAQVTKEGVFLLHLLPQSTTWPRNAQDWIVARLGELHEKRAVPALFQRLVAGRWSASDAAQNALIAIGSPQIRQGAMGLLARPDADSGLRRQALALLAAGPAGTILPVLRRMVRDKDAAVRSDALADLSRYGTADDLATLLPMADFWTGDRPNHYWAMQAVVEIWDRLGYDENGPIRSH